MASLVELLNGPLAARLLRNRGKLRAFASATLASAASSRLEQLISGQWQPSPACSDTAVSMTSWTPRLTTLPQVLVGLLGQDIRPQFIFVWLTAEDLKLVSPLYRESFTAHGVRFRESPDYRAHKKWLPLVSEGYSARFVICDDDVFYPREWFGRLLAEDRADAYVGTRGHRMRFDRDGRITKYELWNKQVNSTGLPSFDLFLTGIGGAIVHPKRIAASYRDWSKINAECPQADDIWLKAAHVEAGIPCYKTNYSFPCLEIPESQESGLLKTNVDQGGNDLQMNPLWRAFTRLQGTNVCDK